MRALVRFEEYRLDLPGQVVAFSGDAAAIPHRIQRMISGRNRSVLKLEAIIISLVTVLFVTLSVNNFTFPVQTPAAYIRPMAPLITPTPPIKAEEPACNVCPYMNKGQNCTFCKHMDMPTIKSKKQL
jgi:hypothetical protein